MLKNQPPKHWELHFSWWQLINGARAAMRWKGALPARTAAVGWHEEKQCVCRRKQDWDNFAWWEKNMISEKKVRFQSSLYVWHPLFYSAGCHLTAVGSPLAVLALLSVSPEETPSYSQLVGGRGAEHGILSAFFFSIKTHPKAKQILFIHKRAFSV